MASGNGRPIQRSAQRHGIRLQIRTPGNRFDIDETRIPTGNQRTSAGMLVPDSVTPSGSVVGSAMFSTALPAAVAPVVFIVALK